MSPINDGTIENKELRGITNKQAFLFVMSLIGSTASIITTVLCTWYSMKADIADTAKLAKEDHEQIAKNRQDVDLLKVTVARHDEKFTNFTWQKQQLVRPMND